MSRLTEEQKAAKREAARAQYKAELAEYCRKQAELAPPLTPEQRDKLAILLRAPKPTPMLATGADALKEMLGEK